MKKIFLQFFILFSFGISYSQDIPFDIMRASKKTNFLKFDNKRIDKDYKFKELLKALKQCDTSFLNSAYGSIYKDNNNDWLIKHGYDTLISIVDVNNDKKDDLIFSYCYACDEQLILVFLNNG